MPHDANSPHPHELEALVGNLFDKHAEMKQLNDLAAAELDLKAKAMTNLEETVELEKHKAAFALRGWQSANKVAADLVSLCWVAIFLLAVAVWVGCTQARRLVQLQSPVPVTA